MRMILNYAHYVHEYYRDLQPDLNYFQTWCSDNLLDLNKSKCKVITFCRVNPQYATYTLS